MKQKNKEQNLTSRLVATLTAHDITGVRIDRTSQVTVTVAVPLDREKGQWIEQDVFLSAADGPDFLRKAAREMVAASVEAVKEADLNPPEVPCATCIAACCRHQFEISLTQEDMERLRDAPASVRKYIQTKTEPGLFGEIAIVGKKKLKNPVTGEIQDVCALLHKDGYCSIHPQRPQVCRDWDPFSCEMRVEKLNTKKKHLPIWSP